MAAPAVVSAAVLSAEEEFWEALTCARRRTDMAVSEALETLTAAPAVVKADEVAVVAVLTDVVDCRLPMLDLRHRR